MKHTNEISGYRKVRKIQASEIKQKTRDIKIQKIEEFAKQNKTGVKFLSLPSTEWPMEKGGKHGDGLIKLCKENGIKLKMVGVENSCEKTMVKRFKKNAPKNAEALRGDFDTEVGNIFSEDSIAYGCNVIDADYCGNPAEVHIYDPETKKIRYSYSHIKTFRDTVKKAKRPMLYFMTFSCNGRIKGGAEGMQKALSPNATSIRCAIVHKVSQTLATYGLAHKAKLIMKIYYHGAGRHFMLTIGYAINYSPKSEIVKENWVKVNKTAKASKIRVAKIDWTGIKKEAMKALCDKGWTSENIAHALNTQKSKVRSVLAWHKHRDSWKKVA